MLAIQNTVRFPRLQTRQFGLCQCYRTRLRRHRWRRFTLSLEGRPAGCFAFVAILLVPVGAGLAPPGVNDGANCSRSLSVVFSQKQKAPEP
jgi:hypothetical protein